MGPVASAASRNGEAKVATSRQGEWAKPWPLGPMIRSDSSTRSAGTTTTARSHRVRDRAQRGKRGQSLHGGARGFHWVHAPRVAVTEQERQRLAADLDRVVGGAHHRDGARPEHRAERAHGAK